MKKIGLICISALAACTLMGINKAQSGSNNTNYVVAATAHKDKFSNKNYAVMSFLKLTKQKVTDVQNGAIKVTKKGASYKLTDGQNKFKVKVAKHTVTITDNKGKKHSYAKKTLAKSFKKQEGKLNALVARGDQGSNTNDANDTASSQATAQSQTQNNTGNSQQQNTNGSQNNNSGDTSNNNATKESTDENGDVHHITLSGQHDDEGRAIGMDQVTGSDGITRTFDYTEPDDSDN